MNHGHGPPHKKPRGDHHQFSHRAEYDDFPNLREFLERKDEKLSPNHILLITVSIGIISLLNRFKDDLLSGSQCQVPH